jgi:tetratricopeptide (TPR) repeat protein
MGLAQEAAGEIEEALASFARAGERAGGSTAAVAAAGHALAAAGRAAQARERLAELEAMASRRYVSEYAVAVIHAGLGEVDAALGWLQRGLESRCQTMVWLPLDPPDPLRGEDRFADLLAALRPRPD